MIFLVQSSVSLSEMSIRNTEVYIFTVYELKRTRDTCSSHDFVNFELAKHSAKHHYKFQLTGLNSSIAIAGKELSLPAEKFTVRMPMMGLEFHRHRHCKFLCWYQEFLCPVEPLYFSDAKSITVEKS